MRRAASSTRRGPELEENVRVTTEAAAKPVAEATARTVAEQLVRATLAAIHEEEAILRSDVEQSSTAVAERVARELVETGECHRRAGARCRPPWPRRTSCRRRC